MDNGRSAYVLPFTLILECSFSLPSTLSHLEIKLKLAKGIKNTEPKKYKLAKQLDSTHKHQEWPVS